VCFQDLSVLLDRPGVDQDDATTQGAFDRLTRLWMVLRCTRVMVHRIRKALLEPHPVDEPGPSGLVRRFEISGFLRAAR